MKLLARPQLVILVTLVATAALLPFAGCDKATPVAPSGTTLAISASPSTVSLTGTSTITVIGRRPNGSPLIPGTEVQFSTNLGSITPTLATTNSAGEVTAIFRADGRAGAATVTASTSSSTTTTEPPTTGTSIALEEATTGVSVTTTIQVGESAGTKPTLLVSVNPETAPVNGSATVTVIARNSDGSPVAAGRQIVLTTTLGSLNPSRPVTRSDGTAVSTLSTGSQSGTATVTALLGNSDAATAKVEIKDAILELTANPATINETGGVITLTATVRTFQGSPLEGRTVTLRAERGQLDNSTPQTNAQGVATAHLTVPAESLSADQTFQVTATSPSGSGQPLTATVTITVKDVRQ